MSAQEYRCQQCRARFKGPDDSSGGSVVECPSCGSEKTEKVELSRKLDEFLARFMMTRPGG